MRLYKDQELDVSDSGRGSSWAADGDIYLREVTVGDFALVRIKIIWTRREMPESIQILRKLFDDVLEMLDGPDAVAVKHSKIQERYS